MLTIETPDKTKISISRDGFHNLFWDETEKVYKIATNNFYMQCITVNKINDINSQIKNLQTELENKKNRERSLQCIVSEKQRTMNNAAVEMAYHKKHMY